MSDFAHLQSSTERGDNVAHPTVGRMVHVWLKQGQTAPLAAIVSAVDNTPNLSITAFVLDARTGPHMLAGVTYGAAYHRGPHWSWPDRAA